MMNGLNVRDFDGPELAMQTADQLIELSAQEFGFQKDELPHDNPLLTRHYYVISKGKSRTMTNIHSKEVGGNADLNKDGKAGGALFALNDGDMTAFEKPGEGVIKMEFPHLTAAQTEAETLRSVCAHTRTRNAHPTSPLEEHISSTCIIHM